MYSISGACHTAVIVGIAMPAFLALGKGRIALEVGARQIENGTHQRLDVKLNDDRSRVRHGNGQLVLGLFRRLVISLFMHTR